MTHSLAAQVEGATRLVRIDSADHFHVGWLGRRNHGSAGRCDHAHGRTKERDQVWMGTRPSYRTQETGRVLEGLGCGELNPLPCRNRGSLGDRPATLLR